VFKEVNDPSLLPPSFRDEKRNYLRQPLHRKRPLVRSKRGLQAQLPQIPGLVFQEVNDPSLLPASFRDGKSNTLTLPGIPRKTIVRSKRGLQSPLPEIPGIVFKEVIDPSLLPASFRERKRKPLRAISVPRVTRVRRKREMQRVPCHQVKDGKLRVKRDEDDTICYISTPRVSYGRPSYKHTQSHLSYSHQPQSYRHYPQSREYHKQSYSYASRRPVPIRSSYQSYSRPVVYPSHSTRVRTHGRTNTYNSPGKRVWYYKPEGSHRSQIHHVEHY